MTIDAVADDPRAWLGRGLFPVPGKPFGWAWNMERQAIRDHLKARGRWAGPWDEFAVSRIQQRLNREWPARWTAIKAGWRAARPTPAPAPEPFTADELDRIAAHFAGANDPDGQAIAAKAAALANRVTR